MGLGPCPYQVFEYTWNSRTVIYSSFSSYRELENHVIEHAFSYVAIWCFFTLDSYARIGNVVELNIIG